MCEDKGWTYTGFDFNDAPNVDIVGDIYELDKYVDDYDLVINGQMLEHLDFPLLAVQKMKEVIKVDGWIVCIAPFGFGEHRFPIDCWRFLPDGMKFLLEGMADIETAFYGDLDCYGVARMTDTYSAPWKITRSR